MPSTLRLPTQFVAVLLPWRTAGAVVIAGCAAVGAVAQSETSAEALRARHAELAPQLARNVFNRPLVLESTEDANQLSGNIYAVIERPFAQVSTSLRQPANWCEVLMLHLNTKHCAVETGTAGTVLAVNVGRKFDQPLDKTQKVAFAYAVPSAGDQFLDVRLRADKGPLSTRDYRIGFVATPLGSGKTFLHLRYAYAYGTAARLAMQGYLATLGSDKVGFTPTRSADGATQGLIGGVRGVVERNTMRYYLAIDAFLASLSRPAGEQRDYRTAAWFDATEQYATQLHEVSRADYLAMKTSEFQRMESLR
ncbi:hypothetical protein [uncultured Xylophilus sp.]|uniref:hypothetical protein n=1 Tax=uncultured Xylophilus sp. TaxID=296832 RepID=UPI0025E3CFD0|nr:hypothetical protein [uncultured Xylophilus sp.]